MEWDLTSGRGRGERAVGALCRGFAEGGTSDRKAPLRMLFRLSEQRRRGHEGAGLVSRTPQERNRCSKENAILCSCICKDSGEPRCGPNAMTAHLEQIAERGGRTGHARLRSYALRPRWPGASVQTNRAIAPPVVSAVGRLRVQLVPGARARQATLLNARPPVEHHDHLHGWRGLAPPSSPPGRPCARGTGSRAADARVGADDPRRPSRQLRAVVDLVRAALGHPQSSSRRPTKVRRCVNRNPPHRYGQRTWPMSL